MPFLIAAGREAETAVRNVPADAAAFPPVLRNCPLKKYTKLKSIPGFEATEEMIAYASPDSTYAVTKRLFDGARSEILIGIYDFSAPYMKQLLLQARQRGVKVSLMLDIDSPQEQALFDELAKLGCRCVEAPSCASKAASYFPNAHEKVIVIDGTWCLVQSGNYSVHSIPLNEKDGGDPARFVTGNRDMGVAIKSKELSRFFINLLQRDMKLELDAEGIAATISERMPLLDLVERFPTGIPSKLFPSKTFKPQKAVRVAPVLSPENYMDAIPGFLASAKKSILIENQYIRSGAPEVGKLLDAIKKAKAKNPSLDVRIVLGKLFSQSDVAKEKQNIERLKNTYGLLLGANIRYVDTTRLVHCHNKLIVVDKKAVLVSSQNWSDTAVSLNREAGLLIQYPDLANYYAAIFEVDWSTAQTKIPLPVKDIVAPEAVAKGNFTSVVAADYQEV